MKQLILIGLMLLATLVAGCSHHDTPEPDKNSHTVIVYVVADNSLWKNASDDVNEILRAQQDIPEGCKVAIFVDRTYRQPYIQLVDRNESRVAYTFPENVASTDSATMVSTLKRIMSLSPSDDYSLVLWSHGSGWVPSKRYAPTRAFGQDGNVWMEIPTLRGVLSQFKPFNFILFDACFMQDIETAYELQDVTPWIIGSAAEIPGDGAPYHRIVKDMCDKNIEGIAQHYHDFYTVPNGAVLSVVNTSRLDTLAETTARYLPHCFEGRVTPDLSQVQQYKGLMGKTEVYGMKSAMFHLLSEADYQEWVKVFDEAVPFQLPVQEWITKRPPLTASLTDPEHYGGVAIFLPSEPYVSKGYINFWHRYRWYKDAGWSSTGW